MGYQLTVVVTNSLGRFSLYYVVNPVNLHEMFSFFKNKNEVDYKARLERMMVLAKETPEPVFDLSDCNLKTIPSGVTLLCKVLRKDALLLQKNCLTNLQDGNNLEDLRHLRCLLLQSNKLTKLPDSIHKLSSLQVLNVSDNQLVKLPDTIGRLSNLQELLLANNKLTIIPDSIYECRSLVTLDVRGNNRLLRLPAVLGHLQNLKNLYFDQTVQFPPSKLQDTKAILDFLAAECGELPQSSSENPTTSTTIACTDYFLVEERLRQIEEQKEVQQKRWLALEMTLAEESLKEKEAHLQSKNKQLKLVEDIRQMQTGFDEELSKVQERRDADRIHLIEECLRVEEKVAKKVANLLVNAKKYQSKMAQMTEQQNKLEEELLLGLHLKRKVVEDTKILDVMNELVKEDLLKVRKWQEYDKQRKEDAFNWIVEESASALKVAELVGKAHNNAKDLADALLTDEELQKAAVASLLEQSDAKSWQLAQEYPHKEEDIELNFPKASAPAPQPRRKRCSMCLRQKVALIENQLAELTRLEMSRRKLELDTHLVELCAARVALTEHLVQLFAEKEKRRKELISTLKYLEEHSGGESFWLQQYQALLSSSSRQLVESFRNIDTAMNQELLFYGVSHCLPLIANLLHSKEEIAEITDEILSEAGVEEDEDRCLILKAIKAYLTAQSLPEPTAPYEEDGPSAPPISLVDEAIFMKISEECVVCLDRLVEVVFTPCGHICCCRSCSQLSSCPLCRSPVESVHRVANYQS